VKGKTVRLKPEEPEKPSHGKKKAYYLRSSGEGEGKRKDFRHILGKERPHPLSKLEVALRSADRKGGKKLFYTAKKGEKSLSWGKDTAPKTGEKRSLQKKERGRRGRRGSPRIEDQPGRILHDLLKNAKKSSRFDRHPPGRREATLIHGARGEGKKLEKQTILFSARRRALHQGREKVLFSERILLLPRGGARWVEDGKSVREKKLRAESAASSQLKEKKVTCPPPRREKGKGGERLSCNENKYDYKEPGIAKPQGRRPVAEKEKRGRILRAGQNRDIPTGGKKREGGRCVSAGRGKKRNQSTSRTARPEDRALQSGGGEGEGENRRRPKKE